MTKPDNRLLDDAAAMSPAALLSALSGHPGLLLRLADEIHDLDPMLDAPRLAELREAIRAAVSAARDRGGPDDGLAESARLLLNRVTTRQSPVGAGLRALLERQLERFTPALLRAAWRTDARPWTVPELKRIVDEPAWSFLTNELARLAVVTRDSAEDRDPMRTRYRLTPAGRQALPAIAQRVLELELGRFPWPADLRDLGSWASSTRADFYEFGHRGRDGATVERVLNAEPRAIGSLSVPNLYGIARPADLAARAAGIPAVDLQSIAVLRGEPGDWTRPEVQARIEEIIDDQLKLMDRTEKRVHRWELMMFARQDLEAVYGPAIEDACEAAHVDCSFVN